MQTEHLDYWISEADRLVATEQWAAGLEAVDHALALDPGRVGLWKHRGLCLRFLGRYREASEAYRHATQLTSDDASGWYNLALVLRDEADYAHALEAIDRANALAPADPLVYRVKIDTLYRLRRLDEAYSLCQQWLTEDQENAEMWNLLGMISEARSQYNDALSAYEHSIRVDSNLTQPWLNAGMLLRDHFKQLDQAMSYFQRALDQDPPAFVAVIEMADTLVAAGKAQEAISRYDECEQHGLSTARVWHNKGQALYDLHRYEEALECYNRALRLDDKRAANWFDKGVVELTLHRPEDALVCMDEAIARDPNSAAAWLGRCKSLKRLRRYRESWQAFRRYAQLNVQRHSKAPSRTSELGK